MGIWIIYTIVGIIYFVSFLFIVGAFFIVFCWLNSDLINQAVQIQHHRRKLKVKSLAQVIDLAQYRQFRK